MVDLVAGLSGHEPLVRACVDQRGRFQHTSMPRCSPLWDGWSEQAGSTPSMRLDGLPALSALAIERHAVSPLVLGAWTLRRELRLVDGVNVELARQMGVRLITTDQRLAWATPIAETIS